MSASIEVIIPVRNMADQLSSCVEPLIAQLGPKDVVTVVDDASTDDTAARARALGANVISISTAQSNGPYFARQVAAQRSTADILLFVDARCRALPGLLDSHRALQAAEGTALSCTAVRTLSGPTLAARVAAMQQPFALDGKVDVAGRLDFYPTANLGVRRSAFLAVGGFRSMRSGADADICWRVQRHGAGVMASDSAELMNWEPRSTMSDLMSQWFRYGKSTAYLEWVFPDQSTQSELPQQSARVSGIVARARSLTARRKSAAGPVVRIAALVVSGSWKAGYVTAKRKSDEFGSPVGYDITAAGRAGSTGEYAAPG